MIAEKNFLPNNSAKPLFKSLPTLLTPSISVAAGFNCTGMVNLSELVPTYIVSIPNDPATTTTSGYSVVLVNKQPAVSAPLAELGVKISVGNVPVGLGRVVQSASSSIQNQWSTWINSDPSNNFPYAINFGSGLFGTSSTSNGLDNQNYIIENYTLSNFPSFEYCANLTQGGYDDWYLPAIDELYNSTDPILMYNTFGASTEGDSFLLGL